MKKSKLKIQNSKFHPRRRGYIALIALLVVAGAALTIGLAVSLSGISAIQESFSVTQSASAKSLANLCLQEGLEKLRQNWVNYSSSLSVGPDSCIINTVVAGNSATLTSEGTIDIYTQRLQIQVNQNLEVNFWQEE